MVCPGTWTCLNSMLTPQETEGEQKNHFKIAVQGQPITVVLGPELKLDQLGVPVAMQGRCGPPSVAIGNA